MESLIDPQTLERGLDDSNLRVFDASVHLATGEGGRSGRADWEAGHIPRSGFVDMVADFCEPDADLEQTLGRFGISEGSHVVVYSTSPESTMWATRLWWLLRAAGIEVQGISVGSTPGMRAIDHLDGITEARPGNYVLYDYTQVTLGTCAP